MFGKILSGRAFVPVDGILIKADPRTRAKHSYKFKELKTNTNNYMYSFFPRTIPAWNKQSSEAIANYVRPTHP